ncbi:MAG: PDZ domain-containing protein [Burkholderiales bacterium]|nr:MAG: PDZ domain-containing protein [Burkholderiales bacterium]
MTLEPSRHAGPGRPRSGDRDAMRSAAPAAPATVARRPPLALRAGAAAVLAAVLATGCGGGSGGTSAAASAEVEWVRSVMTGLYLYADRVPAADLTGKADAAQALEALRVDPPDRFSYVETRATYDGFFDDGVSVGLGIGLRIEGETLVLRFVMPDSPADRAGLRRGDRIASIDGVAAATLIAARTVSEALGPAQAGLVVRLGVSRAGGVDEIALAKASYAVAPILASRLIERDGTRIGYLALYTFTETARPAWDTAIASLRAAGATRLVVDLRENGGGRLYVAADIAGSLAPAAAVGQTFTELRHNAAHAADDLSIPMPARAATGTFERVAWLVSDVTCSAAESLIVGLRPYRDDPIVGTRTCGKPVGFEPQVRGDTVLSAVSFIGRNRDGFTDWFDGLAPTCAVSDEPFLAFGDEADPRLAQALQHLSTGACGPTAPAAKSAAPVRRLPAASGLASETGLF